MTKRGKKWIRAIPVIFSLLILLVLTGCVSMSVEDLYALPALSERYMSLQNEVDKITDAGAEYAAPTSGANRQALQLEDIDGDGSKEALAFFRVSGSSNPLQIHVFQRTEGKYVSAAVIEGSGANIESVNYADMNGDGSKEMIVGWQLSSGINLVSAYTMNDFQPVEIIHEDCTEFSMCALSGRPDVILMRISSADSANEAVLFRLTDDGEVESSSALLSDGIEAVVRIRSSRLKDECSAVFVESNYNGGSKITDILAYSGGALKNVSRDDSGISLSTTRAMNIYCRDIDGDGMLEVPKPVPLPSVSDSATVYYIIDWYSYNSKGQITRDMSTYHNFSDNWYLRLPDGWRGNIAVRRSDSAGERAIVFSYLTGDNAAEEAVEAADFLAISVLSDSNREERAAESDRFILLRQGGSIYTGIVLTPPDKVPLQFSQTEIMDDFHIIYSEWITGET